MIYKIAVLGGPRAEELQKHLGFAYFPYKRM